MLFAVALGAIAVGASALSFRPPGGEGTVRPAGLLDGARIDSETLGLVERACQNCHSERTEWPWYGRIPPSSWLLRRDVAKARARFDLSRWEQYSAEEKLAILSAMGAAARTGVMPPGRYTLLHPAARLSRAEREQLYRWTRTERSRLRE